MGLMVVVERCPFDKEMSFSLPLFFSGENIRPLFETNIHRFGMLHCVNFSTIYLGKNRACSGQNLAKKESIMFNRVL